MEKPKAIIKRLAVTSVVIGSLAAALLPIAPAYADPPVAGPQTTQAQQAEQTRLNNSLKNNPIINDIQMIVNFLSAAVGLVVVGMIVVGGIQYSIAGDNAANVTAAKKRIGNALLALAVFMFTFAFLQWLIPGGIFG